MMIDSGGQCCGDSASHSSLSCAESLTQSLLIYCTVDLLVAHTGRYSAQLPLQLHRNHLNLR